MDKYTGAAGTWQEWSFDFITATQAVIPAVGTVLEAMNKASESSVTVEAVNRVQGISDEMKESYGTELFTVLNGLTSGEASTVVRGVISQVGDHLIIYTIVGNILINIVGDMLGILCSVICGVRF